MKKINLACWIFALIIVAVGTPELGRAQTSSGGTVVVNGIANDFDYFLANVDSQQVVTDLRNGQWTTTVVPDGSTTPVTTTEALPTGEMGWGNVRISLALAQHSLSQQGIYQPTQQELYIALMGGETVSGSYNGVLQMRADGMGWGEIAKEYGVTVGELMGRASSANQGFTEGTASATGKGGVTGSGKPSASDGGGIVTSSGKTVPGQAKGLSGTAKGGNGQGIVTGSGKAVGSSVSAGIHSGGEIVTGSGQGAGVSSGIVTGRGHGYGVVGGGPGSGGEHGRGHSK